MGFAPFERSLRGTGSRHIGGMTHTKTNNTRKTVTTERSLVLPVHILSGVDSHDPSDPWIHLAEEEMEAQRY